MRWVDGDEACRKIIDKYQECEEWELRSREYMNDDIYKAHVDGKLSGLSECILILKSMRCKN